LRRILRGGGVIGGGVMKATLSRNIVARLLAIALLALSAGRALAADSEQQQRDLFRQGAKLWPVYCAQCHNARPGSEFSPVQWDVIMMHMRTQANLPANDARALTEYLKRSH
jgi:mono/diheme cytochrome c family protein